MAHDGRDDERFLALGVSRDCGHLVPALCDLLHATATGAGVLRRKPDADAVPDDHSNSLSDYHLF